MIVEELTAIQHRVGNLPAEELGPSPRGSISLCIASMRWRAFLATSG